MWFQYKFVMYPFNIHKTNLYNIGVPTNSRTYQILEVNSCSKYVMPTHMKIVSYIYILIFYISRISSVWHILIKTIILWKSCLCIECWLLEKRKLIINKQTKLEASNLRYFKKSWYYKFRKDNYFKRIYQTRFL